MSNYFRDIFSSTGGTTDFADIINILILCVTLEMNRTLTTIPSVSKIRHVVYSINGGKALGPDGFFAKFYQAYWHIIHADMIRDVKHLFESRNLHPQQNKTHIRLIPNQEGFQNKGLLPFVTLTIRLSQKYYHTG